MANTENTNTALNDQLRSPAAAVSAVHVIMSHIGHDNCWCHIAAC